MKLINEKIPAPPQCAKMYNTVEREVSEASLPRVLYKNH